jgi:hypothetical protein
MRLKPSGLKAGRHNFPPLTAFNRKRFSLTFYSETPAMEMKMTREQARKKAIEYMHRGYH